MAAIYKVHVDWLDHIMAAIYTVHGLVGSHCRIFHRTNVRVAG